MLVWVGDGLRPVQLDHDVGWLVLQQLLQHPVPGSLQHARQKSGPLSMVDTVEHVDVDRAESAAVCWSALQAQRHDVGPLVLKQLLQHPVPCALQHTSTQRQFLQITRRVTAGLCVPAALGSVTVNFAACCAAEHAGSGPTGATLRPKHKREVRGQLQNLHIRQVQPARCGICQPVPAQYTMQCNSKLLLHTEPRQGRLPSE